MRSFSQTTPLRHSALIYILARAGVNAQLSSSVCSAVTVTFVPEPLTVTVYTGNVSSVEASSSPSVGVISSLISSSTHGIATGLPSSSLSLSTSSQITTVSTVLPTGASSYNSIGISATSPSVGSSLSSVSQLNTGPSTIAPTLVGSSVSISDLAGGLTSSLSVTLSSNSLNQPSSGVSSSMLDASLSSPTTLLGTPTSIRSSSYLPSASLSISKLQPSSLSSAPSASVTSPVLSQTSGLTSRISSSVEPFSNSLTQSLILPTLSQSAPLTDPSTSLATPTGLSTNPSSVSAVTNLPITLLSVSTLSSTSTSTVGAIPTPNLFTTVYCPADDGLTYLSPDDRPFQLACSTRRFGNYLSQDQASSLQSCTDYCGLRPDCQSVSYLPANGTCFLYSDPGSESPDGDYQSASATDLSCPGADNAQYMDSTGSFYQVLCDYSFPESYNIATSPGSDYLDCSSQCSELLLCSSFAYTDGVCTFTNGLGTLSAGMTRNGTNTVILISKRAVVIGPGNIPVVSSTTIATNPRTSMSSLLGSMTTLLPGASGTNSLTGTSLSQITLVPSLPSSLSGLQSSSGPTSLGSIDASITNIRSITSSLPSMSIPSIDLGISSLSSSLSMLTTISAPSLTSVSLSSATLPTSQGPSQTAVSYTCPEVDGRIILENGLSYILNCSSIADGTPYASFPAASSFNDCFKACDQSSTEGGAKYCTAFTYEGADRGAGPGTCYLFNEVSSTFLSANGRKAVTAIRAINYVPGAVGNGVSSVISSLLPGGTLPSTLPATTLIPSLSASLPSGIVTLPTSGGIPITTCSNGGNILNGCIDATATVGVGAGVSGGVVLGPSGSPILSAGVSATLGVSLSADVGLGLGLGVSSGLSLGLEPTLGVDLGVTLGGGLGLGLGGGGKTATSTPAHAIASTTLRSASITTTPRLSTPSTTTVFTTSTITSCLTGAGDVLTCPLGGLFTTLPSTSGAVTSISTSTKTQTSVSVSILISYITVTAPASSSSTAAPASTLSTMTVSSSRSSSAGSASSSRTTASTSSAVACAGTINALGLCIL